MSQIGDLLAEYLGQPRKQGEPSMLAPAAVQAAYQSSQRTGAPPPEAVPLPNAEDAVYLQPETQLADKAQLQAPASQPEQPAKEKVVFPEDKWREETAAIRDKRAQGLGMIGQMAIGRKEGDPLIKSMHDQLESWYPKPKEDFSEAEPMVKQLATKVVEDDIKRSTIAEMLSSQLALLDSKKPDNVSQANCEAMLVRELSGTFLKVTNGVMGTSDAVAQSEATRLMGGATSKNFDFSNLNEKGLPFGKSNIENYKKNLVDVMHSMQGASNQNFNRLAKVSSPEFATKALGGNILEPYTGKIIKESGAAIPVAPRISREKPVAPSRTAPEARAVRPRVLGPGGRFVDLP
jgi:hypothetical protein